MGNLEFVWLSDWSSISFRSAYFSLYFVSECYGKNKKWEGLHFACVMFDNSDEEMSVIHVEVDYCEKLI